jgi:hypothetical protein
LTKTSICCSVMLAKQAPTALSKDSSTQPWILWTVRLAMRVLNLEGQKTESRRLR